MVKNKTEKINWHDIRLALKLAYVELDECEAQETDSQSDVEII